MSGLIWFYGFLLLVGFEMTSARRPCLRNGRVTIAAGCGNLRAGCCRVLQLWARCPGDFDIEDSNLYVCGPVNVRGTAKFTQNVNVQSCVRSCGQAQTRYECGPASDVIVPCNGCRDTGLSSYVNRLRTCDC